MIASASSLSFIRTFLSAVATLLLRERPGEDKRPDVHERAEDESSSVGSPLYLEALEEARISAGILRSDCSDPVRVDERERLDISFEEHGTETGPVEEPRSESLLWFPLSGPVGPTLLRSFTGLALTGGFRSSVRLADRPVSGRTVSLEFAIFLSVGWVDTTISGVLLIDTTSSAGRNLGVEVVPGLMPRVGLEAPGWGLCSLCSSTRC